MVSICIEFLGIVEYLFLGYLINDIVKFTSIFTVFCCFNWIDMNLFSFELMYNFACWRGFLFLFLAQLSLFLWCFLIKFLFLIFKIWSSTFLASSLKTVSMSLDIISKLKSSSWFYLWIISIVISSSSNIESGKTFQDRISDSWHIFHTYFFVFWQVNYLQGTFKIFGGFTNIKLVANLSLGPRAQVTLDSFLIHSG